MIPRSVEELSRQLDEHRPDPSKPKTLEEQGIRTGWGEVWNARGGRWNTHDGQTQGGGWFQGLADRLLGMWR